MRLCQAASSCATPETVLPHRRRRLGAQRKSHVAGATVAGAGFAVATDSGASFSVALPGGRRVRAAAAAPGLRSRCQ